MSIQVKTVIDERGWRKLVGLLEKLDELEVRVGVVGAPDSDIVDIAATHEFGDPTRKIPERSYIRRTFEKDEAARAAAIGKLTGRVVDGKLQPEQAMGLLGTREVAAIRNTIAGGAHIPPPLQPETIARKGSDRPLVDTGRLLNSIAYVVEKKGGE